MLLVDSREREILDDLQRQGVVCEMRQLAMGDYLWIAKDMTVPVNVAAPRYGGPNGPVINSNLSDYNANISCYACLVEWG